MSVQYHPDKHQGDAEINKKYMSVVNAYEVLMDP